MPAHGQLRGEGRHEPAHPLRVARRRWRRSSVAVGAPSTPVTGHRLVTGLVPCNVIPDEILTDHPDRFRAMLVESGNPVHSLADSVRMREALDALDLVVVIDVALTETGRHADYVLPAASQFEKWECTFFNLEFPAQLLPPAPTGVRAARGHPARVRDPRPTVPSPRRLLRRAIWRRWPRRRATRPQRAMRPPCSRSWPNDPDKGKLLPTILYETLGPTLRTPDGV